MNEVTRILVAIEHGDPQAAEKLLPLVYEELRKLAAQKLAQEKPGQTLQATALVHEAYLRLVDVAQPQQWDCRKHFLAAAVEAMRRILVDNARRKHSIKRGGGLVRHDLDDVEISSPEISPDLVALDEALAKLADTDKQAAELVTKAHDRTPVSVLRKARSANGDFSARNGGTWRHSLDLRFTRGSLFHRCV